MYTSAVSSVDSYNMFLELWKGKTQATNTWFRRVLSGWLNGIAICDH